jgi:hypothetical protein
MRRSKQPNDAGGEFIWWMITSRHFPSHSHDWSECERRRVDFSHHLHMQMARARRRKEEKYRTCSPLQGCSPAPRQWKQPPTCPERHYSQFLPVLAALHTYSGEVIAPLIALSNA